MPVASERTVRWESGLPDISITFLCDGEVGAFNTRLQIWGDYDLDRPHKGICFQVPHPSRALFSNNPLIETIDYQTNSNSTNSGPTPKLANERF